jgi:hypothetical protein
MAEKLFILALDNNHSLYILMYIFVRWKINSLFKTQKMYHYETFVPYGAFFINKEFEFEFEFVPSNICSFG